MAASDPFKQRAYGQLVVAALEHLAVPSTIINIVEWIVERTPGDPEELVAAVRRTVTKGTHLGFINTLQRRYFLTATHSVHNDETSFVAAATAKRPLPVADTKEVLVAAHDDGPPAKRHRATRDGVAKERAVPPKKQLLLVKAKSKVLRNRKR